MSNYLTTEQARDLFWARDLSCSMADIAEMAKAGIVKSHRTAAGRHAVSATDVRRLVRSGKPAWQILGRAQAPTGSRERVSCPLCKRTISVAKDGKLMPHRSFRLVKGRLIDGNCSVASTAEH